MAGAKFDLVIRGGTVVDGTGAAPRAADVAVSDGVIVKIGTVEEQGLEEMDAGGCIVTPGFVDVHTHYDGQAIWSPRMTPSSAHGVTTVVLGNCGVGFAPCRAEDRDLLVMAMEGVEDIPEVVMTEGLTWDWETFPEYLEVLDKTPRDIDVAAYVPHSALRVYVMGVRGAGREPANADDVAQMREIVRDSIAAGAMGVATSLIASHRRIDGENIPSFGVTERELCALAEEVGKADGVFQLVPAILEAPTPDTRRQCFELIEKISRKGATKVTFTHAQTGDDPELFGTVLRWIEDANQLPDVRITAQVFPRPVGMLLGWDLSANPFSLCPTYKKLAGLPLADRLAELRKPDVRKQIVGEAPDDPTLPIVACARAFDRMYPFRGMPNYEPAPDASIAEEARRRGLSPAEIAYDNLMEEGGQAMMLVALANYADGSLDFLSGVISHPDVIVALGDGGAHYGLICDASYPTFMLTHWVRDREGVRLPVEQVVKALADTPARLMNFGDRGLLVAGNKADINVIDMDKLTLHPPEVNYDLPGGGRRLNQRATGYRATYVRGQAILRDDQPTGILPGRLVRQSPPEGATRSYKSLENGDER